MKNRIVSLIEVISPSLLVVGDLGLFFKETMFAGYILFTFGCILGLVAVAANSRFEVSERFHLLTSIIGFIVLGLFVFTGILEKLIIALLVLFAVDFLIVLIDLRKNNDSRSENKEESKVYSDFNEEKLYDELENIKDEFSHVQIFEEGNVSDIEDLSLRQEAEQIKQDVEEAVIVEDPKEGRYFFKEDGKTFHKKDCSAISKTSKKELKSSNSRTELLAKGYKSCKVCNS